MFFCWIHIREGNGLTRSMSAKGCSPDNAAAEGFFGRIKNEFFHGCDWRGVGFEEFRGRLDAYHTHYNETRIKKPLRLDELGAVLQKSWTSLLAVQKNVRTPTIQKEIA